MLKFKNKLNWVENRLSEAVSSSDKQSRIQNLLNSLALKEVQIEQESDPNKRVTQQELVVGSLEFVRKRSPTDSILVSRLANAYGNLAWYHLFNKQFAEAEHAAAAGLEIDPSQEWIHTNLALGLLFQGKWEEAIKIYSTFKREAYDNQRTWVEVFLQDLDALEEAGIQHPDVAKVRAFLKE